MARMIMEIVRDILYRRCNLKGIRRGLQYECFVVLRARRTAGQELFLGFGGHLIIFTFGASSGYQGTANGMS
jgi:hypothetical protein